MTSKKIEFLSWQRSLLQLLFSLAMALTTVVVSAGVIDTGIDTYFYGATLENDTGVVTGGFIYRLDQMTPYDIVDVHTADSPSSYPESEAGWSGDLFDPLNLWWWGSSTNPGDTATFSFVSSEPIVGGYAEWLRCPQRVSNSATSWF